MNLIQGQIKDLLYRLPRLNWALVRLHLINIFVVMFLASSSGCNFFKYRTKRDNLPMSPHVRTLIMIPSRRLHVAKVLSMDLITSVKDNITGVWVCWASSVVVRRLQPAIRSLTLHYWNTPEIKLMGACQVILVVHWYYTNYFFLHAKIEKKNGGYI